MSPPDGGVGTSDAEEEFDRRLDTALRGTPMFPPEVVDIARQTGGAAGVAIVATDLADRSVRALTHDVVMDYVARTRPDAAGAAGWTKLPSLLGEAHVDDARLQRLRELATDPAYALQLGVGFNAGIGVGVADGIKAMLAGLVDVVKMVYQVDRSLHDAMDGIARSAAAGTLDRDAVAIIDQVHSLARAVRPAIPALLRAAEDPGRVVAALAIAEGREWVAEFLALNGSPYAQGVKAGALAGRIAFEFLLVAVDFIPGLQEKLFLEAVRGIRWLMRGLSALADTVKAMRLAKLAEIARATLVTTKDGALVFEKIVTAERDAAKAIESLEAAKDVGRTVAKVDKAVENVQHGAKAADAAKDVAKDAVKSADAGKDAAKDLVKAAEAPAKLIKSTSNGSVIVEGQEALDTVIDESSSLGRKLAQEVAEARKARDAAEAAANAGKAADAATEVVDLAAEFGTDFKRLADAARSRVGAKFRKTFDDFVRLFRKMPGFKTMIEAMAKGGNNTKNGAVFVMRYCVAKFPNGSLVFEQPYMLLKAAGKGGSLQERAARITDLVVLLLDARFNKIEIFVEFKSWLEVSLTLGKAKALSQLRLDIVAHGLENVRWVFDGSKVSRKVVFDTMLGWFEESSGMQKLIGVTGTTKEQRAQQILAFLQRTIEVF